MFIIFIIDLYFLQIDFSPVISSRSNTQRQSTQKTQPRERRVPKILFL